jgi:hypothetical protein
MPRRTLLLVVLTACGQPAAQVGDTIERVATQASAITGDGATTPVTGTVVWRDATGATVPFLLQFGFGGSGWTDEAGGMFLDSNGIMWAFGTAACGGINTTQLSICPPYAQYNNGTYGTYWDGTNCMGTPYVPYVHAGMAFTLSGPSGTTVRALNKNASVSMQFLQSYYPGTQGGPQTCTNNIVHILAAPLSDAPVVAPPTALPFTLPLQAVAN